MTTYGGHCRCKNIVIQVKGEPEFSVYCHCDDCRRSTGAPLIAAVGYDKSNIIWEKRESLNNWVNGSCTRLFCAQCGSPVAQTHDSAPTRVYFYTTFMDKPELLPPKAHSYSGEQLPWLMLRDDLPRAEKTISIKAK